MYNCKKVSHSGVNALSMYLPHDTWGQPMCLRRDEIGEDKEQMYPNQSAIRFQNNMKNERTKEFKVVDIIHNT